MTKEEAIEHLKERRSFFREKGLEGRAITMDKMLKHVENGTYRDYDMIKSLGFYIGK